MNVEKILSDLEAKHPGEKEYLQAVKEVLLSVKDVYEQHPEFESAKIIESQTVFSRSVCSGLTTMEKCRPILVIGCNSIMPSVRIREVSVSTLL